MPKRRVFAEKTPLGHRVVLTRDRWREIIRFKHPALKGHEEDVRICVGDPEVISQLSGWRNIAQYRLAHQFTRVAQPEEARP